MKRRGTISHQTYGTEKASPLGRKEEGGRVMPIGGFDGGSGRIKFSAVKMIEVK